MSEQLNDLQRDYVAMFNDHPTIVGLSDAEAVVQITEALATGKKMPDFPLPEGTTGEVEI